MSGLRTEPFCKCGHGEWQHSPFVPRVCGGQVDKRHVTAGGPLSPCDCQGFETAAFLPSHDVTELVDFVPRPDGSMEIKPW